MCIEATKGDEVSPVSRLFKGLVLRSIERAYILRAQVVNKACSTSSIDVAYTKIGREFFQNTMTARIFAGARIMRSFVLSRRTLIVYL